MSYQTAKSMGLISCHLCHQLCQPGEGSEHYHCPRCGSTLHSRQPGSLSASWALLLTAMLCLIPANIYPIMRVSQLGVDTPSTIMGGVLTLAHHGALGIAVVVFVASVVVPLLKVAGLAILLIRAQFGGELSPKRCTQMYRLIEFIGKWSMLDIFVIALLAALVNLGAVARIEAGPAATAFGAAVVLTMLSAMVYDPRLIWDQEESLNE
ncbi:paraquat-inducible protein A [Pokkaliibacter sp. CJK22405]|uniref:paraquat-inducible protein A n=1 Tax=Pokkaliibacter sp. CJK22405 TaxID=3384615 RepID=UPI003985421F